MTPSDLEIYLFDLRGYLVLSGALSAVEVEALNAGIDTLLPLAPGEWRGYIHGHNYNDNDGFNLQQIYEGGEQFEKLIDHPAWIEKMKHFVGGEGTFDYHHGPLFIDECFANLRGPGEAIGLHSGGHAASKRNQFRFRNGRFMVGQVNVLIALTDVGAGDGATMVVPASHKANLPHPAFERHRMGGESVSVDGVEGAIEVRLGAGDALLFADTLSHGSAERTNPGERRTLVYRYGPSWGYFRHGYAVSEELLQRLTPARRQIVMPHTPLPREPQRKDD